MILLPGRQHFSPHGMAPLSGAMSSGEVPIDPRYAGLSDTPYSGAMGVLPGRPAGRMRVQFGIHGGRRAFLNVIEGLVQRNARALREGYPRVAQAPTRFSEDHVWRDIPTALGDGVGGAGTFAVWKAAERRADGDKSTRVVLSNGIPMLGRFDSAGEMVSGSLEDPTPGHVVSQGLVHPTPGVAGLTEDKGISRDWMTVTIDDNTATPVREINQAIAFHNANRIVTQGLPPLYESGVRYKVEGTPELWWDFEEQLRTGHDDCEGLAATRAGELMLEGYDAQVHTRLIQKPAASMGGRPGGRLFHAVTQVRGKWDSGVYGVGNYIPIRAEDGTFPTDDPSAMIGYRGYWGRQNDGRGVPSSSMPVPRWYLDVARKMRAQGKDI